MIPNQRKRKIFNRLARFWPVLERFGDVGARDGVGSFKVGNRARDFDDAVIRAGREVEFGCGRIEERAGFWFESAVSLHVAHAEFAIGVEACFAEACFLN